MEVLAVKIDVFGFLLDLQLDLYASSEVEESQVRMDQEVVVKWPNTVWQSHLEWQTGKCRVSIILGLKRRDEGKKEEDIR